MDDRAPFLELGRGQGGPGRGLLGLVGDDPADLAIGAGSIWTTNFGDATVSRIEP